MSTTSCWSYWYISIYSANCFWLKYMYRKFSLINRYFWYPLVIFILLVYNNYVPDKYGTSWFRDISVIPKCNSVKFWWGWLENVLKGTNKGKKQH